MRTVTIHPNEPQTRTLPKPERVEPATDSATVGSRSQQMVKQAADDAMVIPILTIPYPLVTQKYVHTKFLSVPCPGVWDASSDWMEKK